MEDDTGIRITLRMPTVLRDRLMKSAEQASRSMNGEIVFRLDEFDRLRAQHTKELQNLEQVIRYQDGGPGNPREAARAGRRTG